MKILLVKPNMPNSAIGVTEVSFLPLLSLETLAACVPEHEIVIVDMRLEPDVGRYLREFQPDIVGLSGCCTEVAASLQVMRQAKRMNPGILTVAGGHHATVMPQDFNHPEVDVIVVGEGEHTFPELLAAHEDGADFAGIPGLALPNENGLRFTPPRPQLEDLDSVPIPSRHLTEKYNRDYFMLWWRDIALMETSRGCPYKCNFCSIWKFNSGTFRFKSPERVVNEIATIKARHIYMADDNFLAGPLERIYEICDLLKRRGIRKQYLIQARSDTISRNPELMRELADVGLQVAYFGAETYRQEDLDRANKNIMLECNEQALQVLKDLGIHTWIGFIVNPDWAEEEFKALRDYGDRIGWTMTQYTTLTPLPGTDLFYERYNDLLTRDFRKYDFLHTVLPTRLPQADFYRQFAGLYRHRYFTPRNFWHLLRSHKMHSFSLGGVLRAFRMLTHLSRGDCYQLSEPSEILPQPVSGGVS